MKSPETTTTEEESVNQAAKGIVIHIQPRNIARFVSAGLGLAIKLFSVLKASLDQNMLDETQEEGPVEVPDVPICPAIPVPDIIIDEKGEEEFVVDGEQPKQDNIVNWNKVEKAIEDGVDSVDWDRVGESIKKGVESVDWDEVGNRLEEWSRSVDWDKVGKSISEAFEQREDNSGRKK